MRGWPQVVLVLGYWFLAVPVWAERTVSAEKPIVVRVEVHKPTSIEMPEILRDVVVLNRPDLYSIDSKGPYVYIHPLQDALDSRFFVIGESGRQYQILFKVASPADDVVRVTSALPANGSKAVPFTDASWLRALRLRKPIPGAERVEIPLPTVTDGRLAIVEGQTVGHGPTLGMVLTVQNLTAQPLTLDIRLGEPPIVAEDVLSVETWHWPPRLTVKTLAVEPEDLGPGMQGHVYVVFERRLP